MGLVRARAGQKLDTFRLQIQCCLIWVLEVTWFVDNIDTQAVGPDFELGEGCGGQAERKHGHEELHCHDGLFIPSL